MRSARDGEARSKTMLCSFLFCSVPLCFEYTESLPSFGAQPLKGPIVRDMLSPSRVKVAVVTFTMYFLTSGMKISTEL